MRIFFAYAVRPIPFENVLGLATSLRPIRALALGSVWAPAIGTEMFDIRQRNGSSA
jgi:hypothetical protein